MTGWLAGRLNGFSLLCHPQDEAYVYIVQELCAGGDVQALFLVRRGGAPRVHSTCGRMRIGFHVHMHAPGCRAVLAVTCS